MSCSAASGCQAEVVEQRYGIDVARIHLIPKYGSLIALLKVVGYGSRLTATGRSRDPQQRTIGRLVNQPIQASPIDSIGRVRCCDLGEVQLVAVLRHINLQERANCEASAHLWSRSVRYQIIILQRN